LRRVISSFAFLKERTMSQTIAKHDFLNDLRTRNDKIRHLVQAEFVPLDRAARSTQPEPNEWCVDQCFQHLVLTFESFLPQAVGALKRRDGADSAQVFKRSWLARRNLYRQLFNPSKKVKTRPKMTSSEHYYPDVFERFLAQKEHMSAMLEDAAYADLQTRCWYLKVAPINLGDYLEQFVMHDELHIDQAQRALAAYRQSMTSASD
jgi:hypothetical protein